LRGGGCSRDFYIIDRLPTGIQAFQGYREDFITFRTRGRKGRMERNAVTQELGAATCQEPLSECARIILSVKRPMPCGEKKGRERSDGPSF